MPLEHTIENLPGTPVCQEEVLVLNTIPLTRERFDSERGTSFFWKYKCDFLRQFPPNIDWHLYNAKLVEPVLAELSSIRELSRATIDYDVRVKDFELALYAKEYSTIFLVAHHIKGRHSIEFSGMDISLALLQNMLRNAASGVQKNVFLFICESDAFEELKFTDEVIPGSITFAYWQMPVLGSYRFIRHWIIHFNGSNTAFEAYSESIKTYMYDIE